MPRLLLVLMYLKMQMRPCRAAGMAHIGNDLPGLHLLPHCNADTGAMGIQSRASAAVIYFDIVPIAAAPSISGIGNGYGAVCGC